jgi:hypothetical protein
MSLMGLWDPIIVKFAFYHLRFMIQNVPQLPGKRRQDLNFLTYLQESSKHFFSLLICKIPSNADDIFLVILHLRI